MKLKMQFMNLSKTLIFESFSNTPIKQIKLSSSIFHLKPFGSCADE